MLHRVLRPALCLLVVALGVHCPDAHAQQPITFYGDRTLAPYEFLEDGIPKGASVEFARAIGRHLGRPVEIRLLKWEEAQDAVKTAAGDAALLTISRTPERDEVYDFSEPVFPVTFSLFVRTDTGTLIDSRNLAGLRIGVTAGGFARQHLQQHHPDANLVIVTDNVDGTRKVLRGEIDAFAAQAWSENYILRDLNISGVASLPTPFAERVAAIAVRDGNRALLDEINRAIVALKADGTLDRIIDNWSFSRVRHFNQREVELVTVLAAGGVLLLVLLVVLLAHVWAKRRALAREIEQRKLIEAELHAARDETERAHLSKSKFFAAASHDLRQPVQALVLLMHALAARLEGHSARPTVDIMGQTLNTLTSLLDGVLDISKLDANVVTVQVGEFPVTTLLQRLEAEYEPRMAAKGLRFRVVGSRAWIGSDAVLLGRIVGNLLENAVKYTPGGGVLLGCRRRGGSLRIEVWDTGLGIPPDRLDDVFQEFVRIKEGEHGLAGGLGLGLAIVQRLARLLGHRVDVRSRSGRGSMFAVEVPVVEERTAGSQHTPLMLASDHSGRGLAVVIEDEAVILEGIRMLLEEWGYQVIAALGAAEAVTAISTKRRCPDLILSDYRLQEDETGLDAVRQIRAFCNVQVPGLILTGDTSDDRAKEVAQNECRILYKPFHPEKLAEVLRAFQQAEPPPKARSKRS